MESILNINRGIVNYGAFMRSRTSQWVFVGLVALVIQACGQEPAQETPRRKTSVKESASNRNSGSGSTTSPAGTNQSTGTVANNSSNSFPTAQTPTTQQPTPTSSTPQQPTPAPADEPVDTSNGRVLNMATVYNQGSTQYCWAYSTFHTLRTFYNNSTATDSATVAWREALKKLDDSSTLMSFMKARYNTGRTGFPSEFLDLMKKEYNLPAVNADWEEFYVGAKLNITFGSAAEDLDYSSIPEVDYADYGSVKTNRNIPFTTIMTKFQERIQKGLPSVYCDKGHCMSMYGYTKTSSGVTYNIADSIGGKKYTETESKVKSRLYMMMTK